MTTTVEYHDIQSYNLGGYWGEDSRTAAIAEHLELIDEVELAEPNYSFDLLRIYVRKSDGMLLWAQDAGCSCPSPFESTTVSELRESTMATLADAFFNENPHRRGPRDGWGSYSEAAIRASIREVLKEAKSRGAR